MNKPKFVKKIPTCVILTNCAGYCLTQSHQVIGAQRKASAVGRENPFADIPRSPRGNRHSVDGKRAVDALAGGVGALCRDRCCRALTPKGALLTFRCNA